MVDAMRLPDLMLTHGMVRDQKVPLKPGTRYRVRQNGRRCVYLGPHRRRDGMWSGKVRILYTDTQHEAVVAPGSIDPITKPEGGGDAA